jgi:hypothetical protein
MVWGLFDAFIGGFGLAWLYNFYGKHLSSGTGIKSSLVWNFMERNGLILLTPRTTLISKQKLTRKVKDERLYFSCRVTEAKIKKMESKKVITVSGLPQRWS